MECPCRNCIGLAMCVSVKANRLDLLLDKCVLLSDWLHIKDIKLVYKRGRVKQIFLNHQLSPYLLEERMSNLKKIIPHLDISVTSKS